MINLLHGTILGIYLLSMVTYLFTTCFASRRLPISPLKYDPDDPSTFPPEERAPGGKRKPSKKKTVKRNAKTHRKSKSKAKTKSKSRSTQLDATSQVTTSMKGPPPAPLRQANDLETVNAMPSAWGAVQEFGGPIVLVGGKEKPEAAATKNKV
ncbi:hypothetical protein V3C99_016106 [Haemonchus contortus]|uniref:Secreted protein n=1 Tax=Haemonchus contortus TaxID=6289 RepID=A0A7I4YZ19_HAECO